MQAIHHTTRFGRALRAAVAAAFGTVAAVVLLATPVPAAAASRYTPVTAVIPVNFAVTGDIASEATTFTANIAAVRGETVAPEVASVTSTGAGAAELAVTFDEVGEHHYTVTQTAGTAEGWTYDTQTYDVTAYCMWDETTDTLFTKTVIKDASGYKADACTFTNSYKAPVVPSTPSSNNGTSRRRLTQTGDTTSMMAIGALLAVGVVVVCAGLWLRRRAARRAL